VSASWFDAKLLALIEMEPTGPDVAFGPDTDAVRMLADRCWYLSFAESGRLRQAYEVLTAADRQMAETVAEYVAEYGYVPWLGHANLTKAIDYVARNAQTALCGPDDEPPAREVWEALRLVTLALCVRSAIGTHGFTQRHYDLLTGPWRAAVGKAHFADAEVAS
jgi:hypothetical protein